MLNLLSFNESRFYPCISLLLSRYLLKLKYFFVTDIKSLAHIRIPLCQREPNGYEEFVPNKNSCFHDGPAGGNKGFTALPPGLDQLPQKQVP